MESRDLGLNPWKQHLARVPESIWERTDLETLVLAENALTEISGRIGKLKKLRALDLGHNRLTSVPHERGDLGGLADFLYLHDNQLTGPPASIASLTRLEKLDLRWVDIPPSEWFVTLEARGCLVYR